ncbi:unnamed protein product [Sordaria macrospora k-hell]|uniref:WGS project CABT00000000 data, contig 2.16 n=1 Tax=Sordaria macrospora (strain ATCC MYA-333 / DSM 997 / K(L3346) / K-hell) TaxID=771870 RepID=F7VZZ3_SORMK|nr:uncharacterized protein SMAC_03799 [Sordaria macrospora k-hell]CCC11092.1 unnamed protein product [Sordaria macrospora k-hell]
MASAGQVPIATVYVRNLEERVKPEPLKEALRTIFSEYGNVIDIVAKTNLKAKGQAFVVFDKPESAQAAIEELQGFELFEKPMLVALAKTRSDATVIQTGNEEEFDQHKRRRIAEKDKKRALEVAEQQNRLKRPLQGAAPDARPAKNQRGAGLKATGQGPAAVVPDEYLPPNRILSFRTCPTTLARTTSLPSSPASRASAKSVLCLVAAVLLSSSTTPRPVLSPPRRTRPAWL